METVPKGHMALALTLHGAGDGREHLGVVQHSFGWVAGPS